VALRREEVNDPSSQLRHATRRAKSDVANKLVSMFLHELSRRICQDWPIRVDSEEYTQVVRERFVNQCPYCSCDLANRTSVIEHLDGMNRLRAGLHVPGNVLVACRRCNNEKRREDASRKLTLSAFGWESFLLHDGSRCVPLCRTCGYWKEVWPDEIQRGRQLTQSLKRIREFRCGFPEFAKLIPSLMDTLPIQLSKLYSDCQCFAEKEMNSLLGSVYPEMRSSSRNELSEAVSGTSRKDNPCNMPLKASSSAGTDG
jgi:hypothetical protein